MHGRRFGFPLKWPLNSGDIPSFSGVFGCETIPEQSPSPTPKIISNSKDINQDMVQDQDFVEMINQNDQSGNVFHKV